MEIFKLIGSIMVDSASAEKSISKTEDKAGKLAEKLSSGIKTAAKWGAGIAAAATAAGAAMLAAAKDTAADLDVIDKASQRMGITAEQYQELAYAAGLCGVEMSTMEAAAKKLEGTDLNMDDAINQLMSIEDGAERTQAAIDLFGESIAYKLQPMLNAGAEGMDSMRQEAHDLGLVMDGETVAAGANMNDMFSKVEQSLDAMKNGIVTGLFPVVEKILAWVIENMPVIQETVQGVLDAVMPAVEMVMDTIMELLPPLMEAIKGVIDFIMPYVEPVIDAIAAAVTAVLDLINGDIDGFWENIKTAFEGLVSVMTDLGTKIFTGLWDGLKGVWTNLSGWFSNIGDQITGWFTSIGDSVAGWWDDLWGGGSHAAGLPTVPYDGYRATLHKGETVLNENDTNKLMALLNGEGGNGGDAPINITVQSVLDGKIIGESAYQYSRRKSRAMGT